MAPRKVPKDLGCVNRISLELEERDVTIPALKVALYFLVVGVETG